MKRVLVVENFKGTGDSNIYGVYPGIEEAAKVLEALRVLYPFRHFSLWAYISGDI